MKRLIAYSFFMVGLAVSGFSQAGNELLPLEKAIDLTLANNYDIKLERFNEEVDANNVSRAVSGQMPRLDVGLNYEYGYSDAEIQTLGLNPGESNPPLELDGTAQTFSAAPELSVPIFNGFRQQYRYKQLETTSKVSTQRVNQTIERSISQTVSAYLEVARLQSQLEINEEIIAISGDRYARTIEDARYGATNSIRKLQAEVDLKTDSANYRNTLLAYENSRRNLNLIMGQNPERAFTVQEDILLTDEFSYDELRAEMLANNSMISISKLNVENANYETEIAKSTLAPSITGYANYSYLDSENEANFLQSQQVYGPNVGIRMSWNIFNGGGNKIQRQNADVRLQQQQTALQSTELTLEKELRNAYSQYLNNREQLRIERSNLPTYQLNYDKTSEDFKLGLVDASDVRTAQLNLSSAKNRINSLTYSVKQSEIRLLELSGRLRLDN